MSRYAFSLGAVLGAAILASCAQQEPTLTVEPTYDKVGGASCEADLYLDTSQQGRLMCVAACPRGSTVFTTAAGQRICVPDQGCPPGTRAAPVTTVAAVNQLRCVPIRDDGDPQGQSNQQQYTRG